MNIFEPSKITTGMIKILTTEGKTIISINGSGRIDSANSEEMYNSVMPFLTKDHKVILDLKKVIFIDTEGFKKLVALKKEAESAGCSIQLSQISDALSELFNLMELHDLYKWTESYNLSGKRLVLN